jgi:excisionase family DNA binding protein
MQKLLDVKEAGEVLGVSPWTVRAFIRDGKLRPIRVGRLVRLEERELEQFILAAKAVDVAEESSEKENAIGY